MLAEPMQHLFYNLYDLAIAPFADFLFMRRALVLLAGDLAAFPLAWGMAVASPL